MSEGGWIKTDAEGHISDDAPFHFYIGQAYFMTTTMTTIGYGDYNAAKYPDYGLADNMTLIALLLFFSIFTFSLIQDRLLSIVFDVKL